MALFGGPKREATQVIAFASPADRNEAEQAFHDASSLFISGEIGAPSRLGVGLIDMLLLHPVTGGTANEDPARLLITMGYCLRCTDATRGSRSISRDALPVDFVPMTGQPPAVDYEQLAKDEQLFKLFDALLGAALEEETLPSPPGAWNPLVAMFTIEVHRRLGLRGDVAKAFSCERVGMMLGHGYAVRALEEQVDEQPASKDDLGL